MMDVRLEEITGGGAVQVLAGHERGVAARKKFGIEDADIRGDTVVVHVPSDIYAVSPSFFQGMLAESVRREGSREAFLRRYSFEAAPVVMQQIDSWINSSLTRMRSIFDRG